MKQSLLLAILFISLFSCKKTNEDLSSSQARTSTTSRSDISVMREEPGNTATCGQLRTQSPGGWGASPHGNNPGTYLYASFNNAFPAGLIVGCSEGYSLSLSSADAVNKFLPSGGKARVLSMNYSDPTNLKNVLAGHLVALSLTVGFDEADPAFGEAGITIGAMNIKSGAFQGWTVSNFLLEANNILGGCSTQYSIQDVLTTAANINENYLDGISDNGYLVCPN